jgi:lactoylglutathione lyase
MSDENKKSNYRLAHTMIRVLDLDKSIHFYCDILGMQVLRKTDYPGGRYTRWLRC